MPDLSGIRIDGDRLWASLMAMAEIGATAGGGSHRLALSDEDRDARELLAGWCHEIGVPVRVDGVGNMFARRPGTEPDAAPVVIGSHLDTQPMGGRFDGVLGVLAALEVLRTLHDEDRATRRPVELVNWTNEEGARFAPAMIGSSVFAGLHNAGFALDLRDGDGRRFGDELARIEFAGEAPIGGPIAAYLELHIEQGPVLEQEDRPIGVVTHAQGVRWLNATIEGVSGHAGTTPMDSRKDALVAAAPLIELVGAVAREHPPGVATVGDLTITPGSRNVIPATARLAIDLRHPDAAVLAKMAADLARRIEAQAEAGGLRARVDEVLAFDPTAFDADCVAAVRAAAESCGYRHREIVSGAGHDACNIARIAPAAMVFCPCVGGVSHTEAEDVTPAWAEAGANVLLHAALALADAAT